MGVSIDEHTTAAEIVAELREGTTLGIGGPLARGPR